MQLLFLYLFISTATILYFIKNKVSNKIINYTTLVFVLLMSIFSTLTLNIFKSPIPGEDTTASFLLIMICFQTLIAFELIKKSNVKL
jgi:hypothetical protein